MAQNSDNCGYCNRKQEKHPIKSDFRKFDVAKKRIMELELGQGGKNAGEFANFLKTSMSELKVKKKSILEKIQYWLDESWTQNQ